MNINSNKIPTQIAVIYYTYMGHIICRCYRSIMNNEHYRKNLKSLATEKFYAYIHGFRSFPLFDNVHYRLIMRGDDQALIFEKKSWE